jgi:DNA-binding transcriptional LysR family regulator
MLFERSAQGLRPTPVGSLLREQASDLRQREIDILSAVAEYQTQPIPRLRLFLIESELLCARVPADAGKDRRRSDHRLQLQS